MTNAIYLERKTVPFNDVDGVANGGGPLESVDQSA